MRLDNIGFRELVGSTSIKFRQDKDNPTNYIPVQPVENNFRSLESIARAEIKHYYRRKQERPVPKISGLNDDIISQGVTCPSHVRPNDRSVHMARVGNAMKSKVVTVVTDNADKHPVTIYNGYPNGMPLTPELQEKVNNTLISYRVK